MAETTDAPDGDDREALQAAATQRLHPMSWLFTLIAQLRMFALPILVLLLGGGRDDGDDIGDLIGLAGAGMLAVVAVWQYFTYRYGFLDTALVIRSGLLQRNLRLIPFDRVQNGYLEPSETPGTGLELDLARMAPFVKRQLSAAI